MLMYGRNQHYKAIMLHIKNTFKKVKRAEDSVPEEGAEIKVHRVVCQ